MLTRHWRDSSPCRAESSSPGEPIVLAVLAFLCAASNPQMSERVPQHGNEKETT